MLYLKPLGCFGIGPCCDLNINICRHLKLEIALVVPAFKMAKNTIETIQRDKVLRIVNLFTTIHDGNFRRHSSMNVTIK